jgi:hypothetical protein
MSQSTKDFKMGQPRPDLMLNSGSTSARGFTTPITVSNPDQISISLFRPCQGRTIPGSKAPSGNSSHALATANGPVQALMIPDFKVPGGNSVPPSPATNGSFHTLDNPYGSPMDVDVDLNRWTAPVSVCHACGSAFK